MKVLTAGRPQKGWAKEFDCTGRGNGGGGCNAHLLVEHDDLFQTRASHQGETEYFVTFRCEACGVQTDVDHYDGPPVERTA